MHFLVEKGRSSLKSAKLIAFDNLPRFSCSAQLALRVQIAFQAAGIGVLHGIAQFVECPQVGAPVLGARRPRGALDAVVVLGVAVSSKHRVENPGILLLPGIDGPVIIWNRETAEFAAQITDLTVDSGQRESPCLKT